MCSLFITFAPDAAWPVLLAGNRDERLDRAWSAPARHWPHAPDIVGGHDALAGGSWLSINEQGVVAALLNRQGSLGPATGKRSRGELPLLAMEFSEASDAAIALADLSPQAYRPFNLIIADNENVFWLRHRGDTVIEIERLPAGQHMLTAQDLNDTTDVRIRHFLPRWQAAKTPIIGEAGAPNWMDWPALLAENHNPLAPHDRLSGLNILPSLDEPDGFATSSSSLLALPGRMAAFAGAWPVWHFCSGAPSTQNGVWRTVRL